MSETATPNAEGHVAIIAGFGVPGAIAEELRRVSIPFCVIELNASTVTRCALTGVHIVEGDCTNLDVLRRAGIEQAKYFFITVPDDVVAISATKAAHRINPSAIIYTRCHYTSAGLQASHDGAKEVIVAEQVVAREFSARVRAMLSKGNN